MVPTGRSRPRGPTTPRSSLLPRSSWSISSRSTARPESARRLQERLDGGSVLTYQCENGATLQITASSSATPRLNGRAIDLNPALTYDSPYLQGTQGQDTISLQVPGMTSLVLDFSH